MPGDDWRSACSREPPINPLPCAARCVAGHALAVLGGSAWVTFLRAWRPSWPGTGPGTAVKQPSPRAPRRHHLARVRHGERAGAVRHRGKPRSAAERQAAGGERRGLGGPQPRGDRKGDRKGGHGMDAAPKPPAGVTAVDPSRRLGREFRDLTLTRTKPRFTVTFSLLRRPLDSTLRSTGIKGVFEIRVDAASAQS